MPCTRAISFKLVAIWTTIVLCVLFSKPGIAQKSSELPLDSHIDYSGQAHRWVNKWIIEHNYSPGKYPIDSSGFVKDDSTIIYNSVEIHIVRFARPFAPLFTKGIISGKQLFELSGDIGDIWWDSAQNMYVKQPTAKRYIGRIELLECMPFRKNRRYLKIQFRQIVFFAELTNAKARRRTSLSEFINGAELTWLFRSPLYTPNTI